MLFLCIEGFDNAIDKPKIFYDILLYKRGTTYALVLGSICYGERLLPNVGQNRVHPACFLEQMDKQESSVFKQRILA